MPERGRRESSIVLLTVTMTREPATDLGYLLHKHPGRVQIAVRCRSARRMSSTRRPPRPAARRRCCSRSTRSASSAAGGSGRRGVRARRSTSTTGPYAASSMLAVRAQGGLPHRADRPLRRTPGAGRAPPLPLEIHVPALPCRGGDGPCAALLRAARLDGRDAQPIPLDRRLPRVGRQRATSTVRLAGDGAAGRRARTTCTSCCPSSTTRSTTG